MSKPVLAFSADLHLAPRAWVRYPGISGDSYYGFEQLVDYCIEWELPLFLGGDIFDKTRPDPVSVHHANVQIDRMHDQDLKVFYTQGQHELDRVNPWLSAINDWPTHLHQTHWTVDGLCVYGIDWMPADEIQREFEMIPRGADILMAHQVWRDLMGPRIGDAECAFSDVPYVKMLMTGDFHRHQVIESVNRQGNHMRVLSPGTLCMQSIDESPAKSFFVVRDDLSVFAVPVKSRRCYRVNITTQEELEIFLTGNVEELVRQQPDVPQAIAQNIIHITYRGDIPEAYKRITSAVGGRAQLFLSPVKEQQEVMTLDIVRRRQLADGGLEACLELLVPPGTAMHRDVLALLRSPNPREYLESMHEAYVRGKKARGMITEGVNEGE